MSKKNPYKLIYYSSEMSNKKIIDNNTMFWKYEFNLNNNIMHTKKSTKTIIKENINLIRNKATNKIAKLILKTIKQYDDTRKI